MIWEIDFLQLFNKQIDCIMVSDWECGQKKIDVCYTFMSCLEYNWPFIKDCYQNHQEDISYYLLDLN